MGGWTSRPGLAVIVVVCVALGSLGVVGGHLTAVGVTSSATHPTVAVGSSPSSAVMVNPSSGAPALAPSTSSTGLAKALAIENGLRAKGVSPTRIHMPNFAGAVTDTAQPVTPSYVQAPAPMGVADIGLQNTSGVLVPYELNTTSVEGTVNITNLQSLYLDGDGPDTYGVQLNSVATGVTVFGNSSYEFWSQNYVDYTVSTQQLVFGDEVWNFSSPSGLFPTSSVYAFSPNGTWTAFPYLYQGYGPTVTIGYPFTLTLYLNTTTIADRPAFYFNYTVSNDTFRQSSSFDYLIFNSTVGTPTQTAPVPYYQADGYNYDPIGLINDMEIDILGNDDGDTTTFTAANATVSLEYWNASAGEMQTVPSAYNAGQETGETSVGLLVYSSGGSSPIGIVRAGPGFVGGLWNYSGGSGAVRYSLSLKPANAFLFVNVGASENASGAQWVPTSPSGTTTFYLAAGGTYYLDFLMSEYEPRGFTVTATEPGTLPMNPVTLNFTIAEGVYTPLFALNNAELKNISASGSGTEAVPYHLYANQHGTLDPQFAQWDDFLFPVFPGLLIANTSLWIHVRPSSFEINLPSWELSAPYIAPLGLPLTNDLQIQFYGASNISLVSATGISGWLSGFLYEYPEGSVMLWDCTNVLVASNTFQDQGNALTLYGGMNNTVWGNRFYTAPVAGANPASLDDYGPWLTGINETESSDLVYDNFFDVAVPAVTPTADPFQCDQYGYCYWVNYTDAWNVSEQPTTNYTLVNGWNLTGSIVGTSYQGGNYWSNYGTTQNPYGVLPYNDSGQIVVGGDYVPLVPFSLYPVTFNETGLSAGSVWNVTANGVFVSSNTTSIEVESPNGTFALNVTGPSGYIVTAAPSEITVSGTASTVNVSFALLATVVAEEHGLPINTEWQASINGTGTENTSVWESSQSGLIVFSVPPGTYNVTPQSEPFYTVTPSVAEITVPVGVLYPTFTYTPSPGTLNLTVTPTGAAVLINGQSVTLSDGALSKTVQSGVDAIEATYAGFYPYFNNVTVYPYLTTTLRVALNPVVQPLGPNGTLKLTITPASATALVDGTQATLSSGAYSAPLTPGVHSIEVLASGYYTYYNNVTVKSGSTTNVTVSLNAVSSSSSSSGSGGISSTGWIIIGVVAALAVIFLIGMIYFSRRPPTSPKAAESSPATEWQEPPSK